METIEREIDIETIKHKSIVGVVALTIRTFILQIIAFGATFLLTLFLTPDIFGIFYVVSAIISFLGYFSDVGLAAALIQKKDDVTPEDLATTFALQQALVVTLVVGSLIFAPQIAGFYKLNDAGLWLFRALVVSFFISSLKTIPSVILERRLAFDKLVVPQIVETLAFYLVAVILAWKGYGITSFTWAVGARAVLGFIAMYIVQPWMPRMVFSKRSAKRLMTFGIPFQLNSFMALLKDDLLTVFLGKVLPFAQVGYIGWAKKWAEVPLRLIMDSVIRVTFPAFARLQHDMKLLVKAIEKTVFGLAIAIFPISTGLLFFVHPMVELIPKYGKWEPALVSFYLFVLSSALAALSTPLINALNALGNIKTTLRFMVLWTGSTWALILILLPVFGFNGVALSMCIIAFSLVLVVRKVKEIVDFSFMSNVWPATIAAAVQAVWYLMILRVVPLAYAWLIAAGISGIVVYSGVLYFIQREKLTAFVTSLRRKP
jgi:PST family polysaccharide transporter